MRAGTLDQRIAILKREITRDAYGAELVSWATFAEVWAAVNPLGGRDYLQGRSLTDVVDVRVRIRHLAGVIPGMRISHGAKIYDVVSAQYMESAKREVVLMCREFVNVGANG